MHAPDWATSLVGADLYMGRCFTMSSRDHQLFPMLSISPSKATNRKRKPGTDADITNSERAAKRRHRLSVRQEDPPPRFWDNLSRQWLTRRALRELDRRAEELQQKSLPDLGTRKTPCKIQLQRFARHGGPDLSSLRAVSI